MTATLFIVACGVFILHNVQGVPRTAAYKFVKCRPDDDGANCVTHQSPEMEWSPELPTKLPASTVQYLDAQAVDEDEDPVMLMEAVDDGSGYEGSAGQFLMDSFDVNTESEMGSGESWAPRDTEQYKVGREYSEAFRRFLSGSQLDQEKPAENDLEEDHLLQL
uniref:serglycin-like n=1 Tax=Doryrhamphus excisus TaxID=161450 RepID=UPI0025AE5D0F|nr:serglycin-like [Doryrhamphus excisus]